MVRSRRRQAEHGCQRRELRQHPTPPPLTVLRLLDQREERPRPAGQEKSSPEHGATMPGFMRSVKDDASEQGPLHDRVAAEIRRAITDGEAKPGERLPPARDLAAVLGVNRNTVLRALRMLRDEGLLEFRRGRGITVVGTPGAKRAPRGGEEPPATRTRAGVSAGGADRPDRTPVVDSVATLETTTSRPTVAAPEGPWRLTLRRVRRDRWTLVAACLFAAIVFCSFAGGPIASAILGHTSTDQFPYAANENYKPVGPWTRVSTDQLHPLRRLRRHSAPAPRGLRRRSSCSARTACSAATRCCACSTAAGRRSRSRSSPSSSLCSSAFRSACSPGYFGGFTDAVISRLTETMMAFPLILFLVFASVRLSNTLTRSAGARSCRRASSPSRS